MDEKIEIDANFLENLKKVKQSQKAKEDDEIKSFMRGLAQHFEDAVAFSAIEKFLKQFKKEQGEFLMCCARTLNEYGVPAMDTPDCLCKIFKLCQLYQNTFGQKEDGDD